MATTLTLPYSLTRPDASDQAAFQNAMTCKFNYELFGLPKSKPKSFSVKITQPKPTSYLPLAWLTVIFSVAAIFNFYYY